MSSYDVRNSVFDFVVKGPCRLRVFQSNGMNSFTTIEYLAGNLSPMTSTFVKVSVLEKSEFVVV